MKRGSKRHKGSVVFFLMWVLLVGSSVVLAKEKVVLDRTLEIKEVKKPVCVFEKKPISCGLTQAIANKVSADKMKRESRYITKYTLKEI